MAAAPPGAERSRAGPQAAAPAPSIAWRRRRRSEQPSAERSAGTRPNAERATIGSAAWRVTGRERPLATGAGQDKRGVAVGGVVNVKRAWSVPRGGASAAFPESRNR